MFFEAFSLSLSLSLCFAGSPSLWWGNDIIFVIEEEYARTHDNLDARLYMSVGELENAGMIEDMKRMEYILQERNYPDLKFKTKIFPDEIHQTCYPAALTRSLMFLYGED